MVDLLNRPERTGTVVRYDFDQVVERRGTDSSKWSRYGDGVLPLWVADMDFCSPQPIVEALQERVAHGVFGYFVEPPALRPVVQERLRRLYGWEVGAEDFMFLPGVVHGLNLACRAVGQAGDAVLVQTPVYPPFFRAPTFVAQSYVAAPLVPTATGSEIDFDVFERAITPRTKLFLLCNPHNPVGRVFSRAELTQMAEICLRHDLIICADEIHQDFIYEGYQHCPIASLAPEVAARTFTLLSPSKTFNIAGLHFSIGLASNADLRARLRAAGAGIVEGGIGSLGYLAGLVAYRDGGEWLAQLLPYLQANRDFLRHYVGENLLGVKMVAPQGTYLAWLDCRGAGLDADPADFFLAKARVALNKGATFGSEGEGFVRLNFGCPRSILTEALEQMRQALANR